MEIKATEEQLKAFGLELSPDSIVWRGQKGKVSKDGKVINFNLIIFNFEQPRPKDPNNDLDCFSYQRHTVFEQYDFVPEVKVTIFYNQNPEQVVLTFVAPNREPAVFIVTK